MGSRTRSPGTDECIRQCFLAGEGVKAHAFIDPRRVVPLCDHSLLHIIP